MRTAALLALLVLVGMAPIAGAVTKVDVSNAQITCQTVLGTVGLKPPLSFTGGPATPPVASIKGTLGGCAVTGASATVVSGSFSGKLTGSSSNCGALFGTSALTGTLTFKWKGASATPLAQTASTVTVSTLTGGTFSPGGPFTGTYGELSLGITGVTGAFTGGDGGTTSSDTALSSQDVGELTAECGAAGIKKITIGLGIITLK